MSNLVSYNGIIEALDNLSLKPGTQKADFVNALKAHLPDQEALRTITAIPPEDLILDIWGVDSPQEIKKRKKSLSSIKSALNKNLKELSKKDKNPEGIIIGRDNTFMVSDEQKNAILEKLGSSMSGSDINNFTKMISDLKESLPEQQTEQFSNLTQLMNSLEDASRTISSLQEQLATKDEQISELSTRLEQYGTEGDSEGEGNNSQELEKDELEIVEEEDQVDVDEDELEIVEEEDQVDVDEDDLSVGNNNTGSTQNKLLEVLSKYMEPEEAVSKDRENLVESEEGLVAQLLARFTPRFIKIAAGSYPIGSQGNKPDEHPLEMIEINSFYLGQYPVSNDLFELFVRETGYKTEAENSGFGMVHQGRCVSKTDQHTGRTSFSINRIATSKRVEGANWRHPDGPGSSVTAKGTHPVVQVSRHDATAFASWAGKRLPSEEEWEAAAHGLEYSSFPWGNEWQANFGNFSSSYRGTTTAMDAHKSGISPLGIADLLGNVYEWTSQLSADEPDSPKKYILKGGCWNSNQITISHRQIVTNTWSNIIGFRCAV